MNVIFPRRGAGRWKSGAVSAMASLVVIAGALLAGRQLPPKGTNNVPAVHVASAPNLRQLRSAFAQLPLAFEENRGQANPQVKFLARGSGYELFLTGDEAVVSLSRSLKNMSVLRMRMANAATSPRVGASERLPGTTNYLIGKDPAKWQRGIPQFARVRYSDVYPGIDLVYYGRQGRLEYDFQVAPGADPNGIAVQFSSQTGVRLDSDGNLVLPTESGDVRFERPRVYQNFGEEQRTIPGKFVLRADGTVGFAVGQYDRSRTLIIDPVLAYSTYLGGSGDESCTTILGTTTPGCPAIAVDSAFNIYVAGSTTSTDFPLVSGATPYQGTLKGGADVFITKLNSTGSAQLFSTYLGGTGNDSTAGIALDPGFNVYVAGTTNSADFPTTSNAVQSTAQSSGNHAFVSEIKSDGTALNYSTYLSGTGVDTATGIAVDVQGKIYVAGTTTSPAFPTSGNFPVSTSPAPFQATPKAINQYFFSKLDPAASSGSASLLYSTYLGGSTPSSGATLGGGIALDTNRNIYLTGGTDFTDMPALNAAGSYVGGKDIWIAKFNAISQTTGSQQAYLTYLGGSGDDIGNGISVDSAGNAYVTGSTNSADVLSHTPNPAGVVPFQTCLDTPNTTTCPTGLTATDAFVAKIGSAPASGQTMFPLNYFSYLGGTANDSGLAIAVDSNQGARVTGMTASSDFPATANAPAGLVYGGGTDAFAARIDTTATTSTATSHYATFLGGSGTDIGTGIAVDVSGTSYLTGETDSPTGSFPTASPFQASLNGPSDAFVTKLTPTVNLALTATASPTTVGAGNQVTFTYTITNNADLTSQTTFTDFLPASGATFTSATTSAGSCGTATGGTVTCNISALNSGSTATVTVILAPCSGSTPVGGCPTTVSNSAQISVPGTSFTATANASATVTDFNISASPASATVPAGTPAAYTVTVATLPTNAMFPDSVSLSCSSGLPTGATCTFTNNPISNLNTGSATSSLAINTTMRPLTTAQVTPGNPLYGAWLPVAGIALLGLGGSRRRVITGILLGGVFAFALLQSGCGSSKKTTPTPTGTPAGTYTINITATSGGATRTVPVTLIVQ